MGVVDVDRAIENIRNGLFFRGMILPHDGGACSARRPYDGRRGAHRERCRHCRCGNNGADDDPRRMTSSRLVARYLSRYRWYYNNPGASASDDDDDKDKCNAAAAGSAGQQRPCLDAAWSHYEQVTLARYYTDEKEAFVRAFPQGGGGNGRPQQQQQQQRQHNPQKQRQQPRPTELYPLWGTPVKELMDFGISVRMYFSTVLVLAAFMALAGLLNVPLIRYFWWYYGGAKDGIDPTVRASAICDRSEWVECATCNNNNNNAAEYPAYRLDGVHVRRNTCDFDDWLLPGLCSYAGSVLLLLLFGVSFFWVQRKAEVVFDEEVQTASDYSIKITNPPPDALDPEEWRSFLGRFASSTTKGVAHVAIALDNAVLLNALVKRRKLLQQLKRKLPVGTCMMDDDVVYEAVLEADRKQHQQWWCSLPCFPSVRQQYAAIKQLEEEIKLLLQRNYKAVAVFATFETERGQRDALHALSTGQLHVLWNRIDRSRFRGNKLRVCESSARSSLWDLSQVLSSEEETTRAREIRFAHSTDSVSNTVNILMFRGRHVLKVKEACEPNDVRWQDLETSFRVRLGGYAGTTLGMIIFIFWCGIFVYRLVKRGSGMLDATIFITVVSLVGAVRIVSFTSVSLMLTLSPRFFFQR